jgi:hypothetical protein
MAPIAQAMANTALRKMSISAMADLAWSRTKEGVPAEADAHSLRRHGRVFLLAWLKNRLQTSVPFLEFAVDWISRAVTPYSRCNPAGR